MKRLLSVWALVLLSSFALAQDTTQTDQADSTTTADTVVMDTATQAVAEAPADEASTEEQGLDERISAAVQPYSTAIAAVVFYSIPIGGGQSIPIVLIVLIGAATYFTIYFKFVNFTKFGLAIKVVRGLYDNSAVKTDSGKANITDGDDPDTIRKEGADGEVTAFQALTAALSATVGLGNIGGVAIAIAAGGPGATFWMILAGLLGMASKFTECTLGVRYREIGEDGTVYGGPMYYLRKGLAEKNLLGLGKVLAVFYAIMMIGGSFGGGNMFQANQAAIQFNQMIGAEGAAAGTVFGVIVAILVAVVIIGGIRRIGQVTERIVPFMVGIYVLAAIIILLVNIVDIPRAFGQIFSGAFTPAGITGGFIGVLIMGFRRAAFSNEAGVGSASVAHSAVKTKYAASEGIVALLEPFIDTVVVCTMTALVIIITNIDGSLLVEGSTIAYGQNLDSSMGVPFTSAAFNSVLPGFSYVLTIAVVLFAFSTMISWSYYGLQAWTYLFGKQQWVNYTYKVLFLLFVVVGAAAELGPVIDFSDAMIFAMIFPNMIGLIILAPRVREELGKYLSAIQSGALDKKKG